MLNIIKFPNMPITIRTCAIKLVIPVRGMADISGIGNIIQKRKLLNVIYSLLTNHNPFNDSEIERELVVIEDGEPAYVTTIVMLNDGRIGHVDQDNIYHVSVGPINAQIILTAIRNCY